MKIGIDFLRSFVYWQNVSVWNYCMYALLVCLTLRQGWPRIRRTRYVTQRRIPKKTSIDGNIATTTICWWTRPSESGHQPWPCEVTTSLGRVRPAISHSRVRPATSLGHVRPTTSHGRMRPATSLGRVRPATSLGHVRPATSHARVRPATSLGRVRPATSLGRVRPATSLDRVILATSLGRVRPATSLGHVRPATSLGCVRPAISHGCVRPAISHVQVRPAYIQTYMEFFWESRPRYIHEHCRKFLMYRSPVKYASVHVVKAQ